MIPTDWTEDQVAPIHKANNITDPGNYRPISIIPAVIKVFEWAVHTQLSAYMGENGLPYDEQSGFQPKHSICSTLIHVSDYIHLSMDRGQFIVVHGR